MKNLILSFALAATTACAAFAADSSPISYVHDQIPSGPWSIHIVKVERKSADYELQTALGGGVRFGLASISEQTRLFPKSYGKPVAAINGDFYQDDAPYEGDPKGLQIARGELVSAPSDWTCFWVDQNGNPQMGKVASQLRVTLPDGQKIPFGLNEERTSKTAVLYTRVLLSTHAKGGAEWVLAPETPTTNLVLQPGRTYKMKVREIRDRGDTPIPADAWVLSLGSDIVKKQPKPALGSIVEISTSTSPELTGATAAISGGPPLVHESKVQPNRHSEVRHPRAAIGWNKDYLYFVEVDGRQPKLSIGMTYREFAEYLLKLGCEEALNLDGGGSATCWLNGKIMNSPSERQHQERGVGNSVVIVEKAR